MEVTVAVVGANGEGKGIIRIRRKMKIKMFEYHT